jgi:hypothetical protein
MLRPRARPRRHSPARDAVAVPYPNERTARTIATMMSTNSGTTTGGTNHAFMFRPPGEDHPLHASRPASQRLGFAAPHMFRARQATN